MTYFQYRGGDAYPVAIGDIWAAGEHRYICASILDTRYIDAIQSIKADYAYIDPPWGQSNLTRFYSKAANKFSPKFTDLLSRVVLLAQSVKEVAFCEMGIKWSPLLHEEIERQHGTILGEWTITYYRRHQAKLLAFSKNVSFGLQINFEGADDEDTPALAMQGIGYPGDVWLDICAGRGLTLRSAHISRRFAIGIELNPVRVSAGLWRLNRELGLPIERIGTLKVKNELG